MGRYPAPGCTCTSAPINLTIKDGDHISCTSLMHSFISSFHLHLFLFESRHSSIHLLNPPSTRILTHIIINCKISRETLSKIRLDPCTHLQYLENLMKYVATYFEVNINLQPTIKSNIQNPSAPYLNLMPILAPTPAMPQLSLHIHGESRKNCQNRDFRVAISEDRHCESET